MNVMKIIASVCFISSITTHLQWNDVLIVNWITGALMLIALVLSLIIHRKELNEPKKDKVPYVAIVIALLFVNFYVSPIINVTHHNSSNDGKIEVQTFSQDFFRALIQSGNYEFNEDGSLVIYSPDSPSDKDRPVIMTIPAENISIFFPDGIDF